MEQENFDFLAGTVLLVDKPFDWTSFDVVGKLRGTIRRKLEIRKIKVGHCGTLDPLATGLLIICTGKKTKTIDSYQGLTKTYAGTLKLGVTTPSYDMETEESETFPTDHIQPELIHNTVKNFVGKIDQFPPIFSALKVNGVPMYKKARKGETVEIKSRNIEILKFEITRIDLPFVDFEVQCSKGTYIRSLAHDFGKALNSGAYLTALRRTHIGNYSVEDAWEVADLVQKIESMEKPSI